jgi:hypothetical protein
MSKEELIDVAHKNYVDQTMFTSDPTWLKPIPCMGMSTGEEKIGARQYMKEEFINKCKTDPEFSEKWGLKIEEQDLSGEERFKLWQNEQDGRTAFIPELLDSVPTKQITITYNNQTIESYE